MKYVAPILLTGLLTGCASLTSGTLQNIAVSTKSNTGVNIPQASCTLKNEKGNWSVVTPNTVAVHKASGSLLVECEKQGFPKGKLTAISRAGKGMVGNIIFGGIIGAGIDHSSGAAYNYPNNLSVVMGDSIIVDRNKRVK